MSIQISQDFWNGKNVFLTGHTGFKGCWMTLLLSKLGANVHGYSLAPNTTPNIFDAVDGQADCVTSVMSDVNNAEALAQAMLDASPDIMIHMAAQPIVSESYRDPVGTFTTNVMGTVHFLESARSLPARPELVQQPKPKLVFVVSSDKCYRNSGQRFDFQESDPMGGHDPYSASKACTELVVESWRASWFGKDTKIKLASGRAGNVIGGGDWSLDRLLPDAARALARNQVVNIRNPHSTRPWQHVMEPLVAYLCVIQEMAERDDMAEGWNVGPLPSVSWPVKDVIDTFVSHWPLANTTWKTIVQPKDLVEAKTLALNSQKLNTRTGWAPVLDMQDAVRWAAEWYAAYYKNPSVARAKTLEQIDAYLALFQGEVRDHID